MTVAASPHDRLDRRIGLRTRWRGRTLPHRHPRTTADGNYLVVQGPLSSLTLGLDPPPVEVVWWAVAVWMQ